MIDYKSNYSIINHLVEKYFSLDKKDLEKFKKIVSNGGNDCFRQIPGLDENLRYEFDLSTSDMAKIDNSWKAFKYRLSEYCIDNRITYEDYIRGVNPINGMKFSKDISMFYSNKNTLFEEDFASSEAAAMTLLNRCNEIKLPKKKFKLVISFNVSDMFTCSSGNSWVSCLNLKSQYSGCYWHGLASIPFDENRGMVSIVENDGYSIVHGIKKEKAVMRSFFLIDADNSFNILRWYPVDFIDRSLINLLNEKTGFEFKKIGRRFIPKAKIHLPKIGNSNIEFYIYQDKTILNKEGDLYSLEYSFDKGNQIFRGGQSFSGPFINCEDGLSRLMDSEDEIGSFLSDFHRHSCCRCGDGVSDDDVIISDFDGLSYCPHCFENNFIYCEGCDNYIRNEDFGDRDYCRSCQELESSG